jgi:hypothetical protein
MEKEMKSILINSAAGVIAGVISSMTTVSLHGLLIAVALFIVTSVGVKYLLKLEDYKWLVKNGLLSYLLLWYVSYTILFNMGV